MATTLMTPGVYIEEKNAFPGSAVAVETAVPVFIGYTEKAGRNGKSLLYKPTRVTSLAVFAEYFGGGFQSKYSIVDAATAPGEETFVIDGRQMVVQINPNHVALLYNAIRLFYYNGGSACYILSVGTYGDKPDGFEIAMDDFLGSETKPNVFSILEKEYEPTLVLMPDIISKGAAAYALYQQVLLHCSKMQSRFGLFDVYHKAGRTIAEEITEFREQIGVNALNYGAAYYPYLKTSVVQANELDYQNLDAAVDLEALLPEAAAKDVVQKFKALPPDAVTATSRKNYHQSLKAASATYSGILDELRRKMNELPPSAAMAGIYTLIDTTRGVWKSPANVSVSMVNEPSINVSHDEQQQLNLDVM